MLLFRLKNERERPFLIIWFARNPRYTDDIIILSEGEISWYRKSSGYRSIGEI